MNNKRRGKAYTREEDERLLKLYDNSIKMNKKVTLAAVAELANDYGICKHRSGNAVSQHISNLLKQREAEKKEECEQIDIYPDIYAELEEGETESWRSKYESLLSALIDKASLYQGEYFNSLKLDFKEIIKWLTSNEGDRVRARMEELEMEVEDE